MNALLRALAAVSSASLLLTSGTGRAAANCDISNFVTNTPTELELVLHASKDWDTNPTKDALGNKHFASDAAWQQRRDQILDALDALVAGCDPTQGLMPVAGPAFAAPYAQVVTWEESLSEALEPFGERSSVLSQVLNAPGTGIPTPTGFQLELAQVVSGGQPGLSVGGAGAISPVSRVDFVRKLGLVANALVIQPVGSAAEEGAAGVQAPQFASAEVALTLGGERTAYDWMDGLTETEKHTKLLREGDLGGLHGTQDLLATYAAAKQSAERPLLKAHETALEAHALEVTKATQEGRPLPPPPTPPTAAQLRQAWLSKRREAVTAAGQSALHTYRRRLAAEIAKAAKEQLEYEDNGVHYSGAVRFRTTPGLEFVPEVPDARSLSLEFVMQGGLGKKRGAAQPPFRYNLGGTGAFSAIPRLPCGESPRPPDARCGFWESRGFVVNAAGGFSLDLPFRAHGVPSTLRANGVFRWTLTRKDVIAGDADRELSYGGNAMLAVPAGEGLFFIGTYTWRWIQGQGAVSSTGFSVAKELPHL